MVCETGNYSSSFEFGNQSLGSPAKKVFHIWNFAPQTTQCHSEPAQPERNLLFAGGAQLPATTGFSAPSALRNDVA
jgi:hypothetical protein